MAQISSGELFAPYAKLGQDLFSDAGWWTMLLATEVQANDVGKMSARSQALMHLTRTQFSIWPYKLSSLLQGPGAVESMLCLLTAPDCALDEFTSYVRKRWPSVEALENEDFQAMVGAFVHLLDGTMYSTERLHSKNPRTTHARQWTHAMDLPGVALFHQAAAGPDWARHIKSQLAEKERSAKATRKRSSDDGHENSSKVARRHGGGGGAWRAMVHCAFQERAADQQPPSFKAIGNQYRALSEEDRAFYEYLGSQATALRRLQSGPAFPQTAVAAAKAAAHRERKSAPVEEPGGLLPSRAIEHWPEISYSQMSKVYIVCFFGCLLLVSWMAEIAHPPHVGAVFQQESVAACGKRGGNRASRRFCGGGVGRGGGELGC